MPTIAYQSMNANSSSEHNVKSLNSQQHTRMAHDHFATEKSDAMILDYPTNQHFPGMAIPGPANALRSSPSGTMDKGNHSDIEFSQMLGYKVLQIRQSVIHNFGDGLDLLTLGELDHTNVEFNTFNQFAGIPLPLTSSQSKACQNFSMYLGGGLPAKVLGADTGWCAVDFAGLVVVFVHVPNAIAKDMILTVRFYKGIQTALGGRVIDIVMGDTNQANAAFTPACITTAMGGGINFLDAHPGDTITPFDSYKLTMEGTNSKLDRKYDVAVYNSKTVRMERCMYFTPQVRGNENNTAHTVSDHMGIAFKFKEA